MIHHAHSARYLGDLAVGAFSSALGFAAAMQTGPSPWAILASIGAFMGGNAAFGSFALALLKYLDERKAKRGRPR